MKAKQNQDNVSKPTLLYGTALPFVPPLLRSLLEIINWDQAAIAAALGALAGGAYWIWQKYKPK